MSNKVDKIVKSDMADIRQKIRSANAYAQRYEEQIYKSQANIQLIQKQSKEAIEAELEVINEARVNLMNTTADKKALSELLSYYGLALDKEAVVEPVEE